MNAAVIAELSEGLAVARSLDNLLESTIRGRAPLVTLTSEKAPHTCNKHTAFVTLLLYRQHYHENTGS